MATALPAASKPIRGSLTVVAGDGRSTAPDHVFVAAVKRFTNRLVASSAICCQSTDTLPAPSMARLDCAAALSLASTSCGAVQAPAANRATYRLLRVPSVCSQDTAMLAPEIDAVTL